MFPYVTGGKAIDGLTLSIERPLQLAGEHWLMKGNDAEESRYHYR
jgi:hypothetical protein